jgi:hypothetical protein
MKNHERFSLIEGKKKRWLSERSVWMFADIKFIEWLLSTFFMGRIAEPPRS